MSRNPQTAAPPLPIALALIGVGVSAAVLFLRHRATAVAVVALLAAVGYAWMKTETLPFVDHAATARPVWRQIRSVDRPMCIAFMPREWRYGLNYYTEKPLPDCRPDHPFPAWLYYENHRVILAMP